MCQVGVLSSGRQCSRKGEPYCYQHVKPLKWLAPLVAHVTLGGERRAPLADEFDVVEVGQLVADTLRAEWFDPQATIDHAFNQRQWSLRRDAQEEYERQNEERYQRYKKENNRIHPYRWCAVTNERSGRGSTSTRHIVVSRHKRGTVAYLMCGQFFHAYLLSVPDLGRYNPCTECENAFARLPS